MLKAFAVSLIFVNVPASEFISMLVSDDWVLPVMSFIIFHVVFTLLEESSICCVPVAAPSCATCLASHSNGDILEQKIIIHLTARNTQPCARVITKCYLHTYHSYCVITLHFCTFQIMITSSYLLSKYTQNLTKNPWLSNRNRLPSKPRPTSPLFNGLRRWNFCHVIAPANQCAFVCHLWATKHSHRTGPATN